MVSATIKITQVMDSWIVSASVREDFNGLDEHDYSHSGAVLPIVDDEAEADALTALLSALGRWVAVTSLA